MGPGREPGGSTGGDVREDEGSHLSVRARQEVRAEAVEKRKVRLRLRKKSNASEWLKAVDASGAIKSERKQCPADTVVFEDQAFLGHDTPDP